MSWTDRPCSEPDCHADATWYVQPHDRPIGDGYYCCDDDLTAAVTAAIEAWGGGKVTVWTL